MIPTDLLTSHITHLECADNEEKFSHLEIQTFCTSANGKKSPLYAKYGSLNKVGKNVLKERTASLWRYFEFLPVLNPENIVSLGEGLTPLLHLENLAKELHIPNLYLKDESLNPTGSFKARGQAVAVSKMKELGIRRCIVPTAGNAGGALAAYCAKAKIDVTVVMPRHTPEIFKQECSYFGAELILVDGLISDCGRVVGEMRAKEDYFDVSTMKEPYRLEGKKTMGFEIAEQMNWQLPDVIFYPTGGGTGLIGIWKAFHEMKQAGWITGKFPKMIAVQTENCQPVVWSFAGKHESAAAYVARPSVANGLAVPFPFAERQILQVLKESGGYALSVTETELMNGVKSFAKNEGLFVAPEGGALLPAVKKAIENKWIGAEDNILLLNTGSGYKYSENFMQI
ncbi:threonine synthase [Dyadobacter psychrotolerans]|uniref:Threonine synthase n=1 Tax=Dyadobacter psychrotolerans TaxID=2541721 RepID=A0A4R5DX74_9BACT|nr:threonine synthase [Dyadobacter psychrotolerans]TDE18507.1 threonine synthase [Dyadobacter psychrotolerans]